jgi:hypothetical protein
VREGKRGGERERGGREVSEKRRRIDRGGERSREIGR